MNNSRKVQRRIDRHLANVGRALDHLELDERREILDGLRTHIREELAQQGSTPSNVDDVRTVLSSMDSPPKRIAPKRRGDDLRRPHKAERLAASVSIFSSEESGSPLCLCCSAHWLPKLCSEAD